MAAYEILNGHYTSQIVDHQFLSCQYLMFKLSQSQSLKFCLCGKMVTSTYLQCYKCGVKDGTVVKRTYFKNY